MTIKQLPKAAPSVDIGYLSKYGIQAYDRDNLYPQNVLLIVGQSKTGTGCLERYIDYIEGNGIADKALAAMVMNRNGETLADLHALSSADLGTFNGVAFHVNYDVFGNIVDAHSIPFENVRLCEPDERGVITRVAVHPDWTGNSTRNGKRLGVKKDDIDFLDVFNPDPEVVKAQIAEAGGIQFYKGQVLYVSNGGYMRYPLAKFDSVLTDMSTDEGLSNVMLRNVRNNFLPAGAFVHYKDQRDPEGLSYEGQDAGNNEDYSEALASLQGDTNACNIMDLTVANKESIPEFVRFQAENFDKSFTETTAKVEDDIYSRFGQEAFLSLRRGKVGFSGQLIQDATEDYARRCVKVQKVLGRAYASILRHWAPSELPVQIGDGEIAIEPITYATQNTTE